MLASCSCMQSCSTIADGSPPSSCLIGQQTVVVLRSFFTLSSTNVPHRLPPAHQGGNDIVWGAYCSLSKYSDDHLQNVPETIFLSVLSTMIVHKWMKWPMARLLQHCARGKLTAKQWMVWYKLKDADKIHSWKACGGRSYHGSIYIPYMWGFLYLRFCPFLIHLVTLWPCQILCFLGERREGGMTL